MLCYATQTETILANLNKENVVEWKESLKRCNIAFNTFVNLKRIIW